MIVLARDWAKEEIAMNIEMTPDELFFFDADPGALPLYALLKEKLLSLLPETLIEVKRTQISFRNRYLFAAVSFTPVRKKKERPPHYLTVTIMLPSRLESPRVDAAVEPYPQRWTHHVMVGSAEEIDDELLNWLREAAAFAAIK